MRDTDDPPRQSRACAVAAVACGAAIVVAVALLRPATHSAPSAPSWNELTDTSDAPSSPHPPHVDPGDLVRVTSSPVLVGFLLDEFTAAAGVRTRIASFIEHRDDPWWRARALSQIRLTSYQLTYLTGYYPQYQQLALPADDAAYKITFTGPPRHVVVDGHDAIARPYTMATVLVSSPGSAAVSAAELGAVGGVVALPFDLPLDPTLIGQRSGWACFDEDGFTHNSMDTESPATYFDSTCEPSLLNTSWPLSQPCIGADIGCHCSVPEARSCLDALAATVGVVHTTFRFVRLPWDERVARVAEAANAFAPTPGAVGADMVGMTGAELGMRHAAIVYRYYGDDSCEAQEGCLPAAGWRKLLLFDSVHVNAGTADVVIGPIAYAAQNASDFDAASWHWLYYFAECHRHPHFSQYCKYNYAGNMMGHKQGFCIQSTNRIINARTTPMWSAYQTCGVQGITTGWADNYNLGTTCQWVDITADDTAAGSPARPLVMVGNPSNWLCEGVVVTEPNGTIEWTATGNTTTDPPWPVDGEPIDKFACVPSPGALDNNVDSVDVANPGPGRGLLTSPCPPPVGQVFGPLRDCAFTPGEMLARCAPGAPVSLRCRLPAGAPPQVLRVCESSLALGTGTACRVMDGADFSLSDFTLANAVILPPRHARGGAVVGGAGTRGGDDGGGDDSGGPGWTAVTFTCPSARDDVEVGGAYSLYWGAVLNGVDEDVAVECVQE